jgi:hypothetical protein
MPDIRTNTTPQLEPESGKIFVRIIINATKPVALELTERYAVTGSGDPSYVSGAQEWNGTTEILKPMPAKINIALKSVAGEVERFFTSKTLEISEKINSPVRP